MDKHTDGQIQNNMSILFAPGLKKYVIYSNKWSRVCFTQLSENQFLSLNFSALILSWANKVNYLHPYIMSVNKNPERNNQQTVNFPQGLQEHLIFNSFKLFNVRTYPQTLIHNVHVQPFYGQFIKIYCLQNLPKYKKQQQQIIFFSRHVFLIFNKRRDFDTTV